MFLDEDALYVSDEAKVGECNRKYELTDNSRVLVFYRFLNRNGFLIKKT
jgi:hypothetical protein